VASEFVPHRGAGRVTVLATSGPRRTVFMPDVPTFAELGYPDITVSEWFGLFAPARTPAAVVEGLNAAVAGALARPEVTSRLATLGYAPRHMAAADFARRILAEREGWGPVVRSTGFTAEE
jgi:tripartite-type tricarboxylate transporter receptor subunit TctC